MSYTVDEVMKFIEEEDVKFIRLAFRDAYGIQKNISVMPGEVKKAFEDGAPIETRNIAGFEHCPYAKLYLKPDPNTMAILPWRPDSGRVLRMFCDVFTPDGNEYESDSRVLLQNAVKAAKDKGINFKFGTETEFYLFKKDDDGNPTRIPYDEAGYMDIAPLDKCENVRREISLTIERMGLTPERSHHEKGPGQNEIDFHYGNPLKAADHMTTFKMVVSTIADRYGLVADFSPLPIPGKPGNGYHINIYAVDEYGNDVVKYAAAGIMDKVREMTIFMNPTDASFTRLGNGAAPDKVDWSDVGGNELLYLETYKDKTKVELRSPDAASNPYLVYALLIYSGLKGIEEKMELPAVGEEALFLPTSRREAAELAKKSDFVKGFVPEEILKEYTMG
ncbi:glutamine synthetase family protein [Butyrivibrio sp. YAB3001]|uniref:glutamine synthetase family protein n=1 Tax=Butyrivibrio sp. YAB3001 TaxID=1520812 RepID=UPI0008F679B7|nr:glutamine synthetase family protein [Butyrivibrio sp. YAB3001]SFB86315.1 glutamine synthetase [Butyrivibrio sp. YAB3001]